MPDRDSHAAVARRNQALLDRLIRDIDQHPEWVAVVAFYKALHVVDAVLFADHGDRHGGDHQNRLRILKTTRRYQKLYESYRPLYAAAIVARYIEYGGREFPCFCDYMPTANVVPQLINHYLRQLERSAAGILQSNAAEFSPAQPPPPPTPPQMPG